MPGGTESGRSLFHGHGEIEVSSEQLQLPIGLEVVLIKHLGAGIVDTDVACELKHSGFSSTGLKRDFMSSKSARFRTAMPFIVDSFVKNRS
jgi:hypothetical protein